MTIKLSGNLILGAIVALVAIAAGLVLVGNGNPATGTIVTLVGTTIVALLALLQAGQTHAAVGSLTSSTAALADAASSAAAAAVASSAPVTAAPDVTAAAGEPNPPADQVPPPVAPAP